MLTPNPTNDRLKFILKTYGEKKPMVVVQMVQIIAATVGADQWYRIVLDAAESIGDASKANMPFVRELEQFGRMTTPYYPTSQATPSSAFAAALVAMVNEMPQFRTRHAGDPVFPWMATQLAKMYPSKDGHGSVRGGWQNYTDWVQTLKRGGTMLAQWYAAERPNLGEYDLDTAYNEAKAWHEEEGPIPQGKVVVKLSDGWTAQQLTTRDQLNAEGSKMQHCVGSYADAVDKGKTTIYSLRDAKGQPHVTIEVAADRVQQTQGKQNEKPAEKYKKYVDEFYTWLEEKGVSTEKTPKHLVEIVAVIERHDHDAEEEYLNEYAQEWYDRVSHRASDVEEWMNVGMYARDARMAEALQSENVTPDEFKSFPWAVLSKISETGDVPRHLDKMVEVGRMALLLEKLAPQRDDPKTIESAQLPLMLEHAEGAHRARVSMLLHETRERPRIAGHEPMHQVTQPRRWNGTPVPVWPSIFFDSYEERYADDDTWKWVYPAEEWLEAKYTSNEDDESYVGPWFIHRFTPKQATEWFEAGIEDGNAAAELRNRRVTPKMITEVEEAGGEWQETEDHIWMLTPQEIIDVIDDRGMRRNVGAKRTSRPRR